MNTRQHLGAIAVASLLAACGGRDDSSPVADPGTGTGAAPIVPTGISNPTSVSLDGAGNVYVGGIGIAAVYRLTPGGDLSAIAGTPGQGGIADGTGAAARFESAAAVAADAAGTVYVGDIAACTLRKITTAGVVTTLAGLANSCHGNNAGVGNPASLGSPSGVAYANGVVYFSQNGQDTINSLDLATGTVVVVAGSIGLAGDADGTGAAARFIAPERIAIDGTGNLYVADSINNLVRKIAPGGAVTTLAGSRTFVASTGNAGSADGSGSAAQFNYPTGVAVDASGNVYVADTLNSTIRKITPGGTVSTLAGAAGLIGTADGSGAAARFNNPRGVGVDGVGNVYVADTSNSEIRKITPAGVVTTIAK